MDENRVARRRPAFVLALLAGLLCQALGAAQSDQPLAPDPEQAAILGKSMAILDRNHYSPARIDDDFAAKTLDRYLSALDPARMVFLRSDVQKFEDAYDSTLDNALEERDLAPAFDVFKRYRQRREQQLDEMLRRAAADPAALTLDGSESLSLDRSDAPWPSDDADARRLWGLVYENDVLNERLAGRSPEEIRTALQRRYTGQQEQLRKIDSDDVFALFLNVVAGEFDPHTNYFPPLGAENFEMSMALSFEGIGAVLGSEGDYVRIESLLPGGPAERSGQVHPTDRIAAVGQGTDGPMTDVVGWRTDAIVGLIRGPRGSTVRLELLPDAAAAASSRIVVLVRDEVKLEDQEAKSSVLDLKQDGAPYRVGVISVPGFYMDFDAARKGVKDYKSSTRDVAALLAKLQEQAVDGIVLDLRDNGGGALTEARALAGLFLGRQPVVQVRDARRGVAVLDAPTRAVYDGPLVVLVNRLSASASEIVAAAIQDHGRGVVAGARTFGKGTVQGLVPLQSGELKLTQAKFYRVSGGSTQDLGVQPDVAFPGAYDPDRVGESALPDALAFDSVPPVPGLGDPSIAAALPALREQHGARAATDPDFKAFSERLALDREIQDRTSLSLNEARRRQDREDVETRLLEIENERRSSLGLDPLATASELSSQKPEGDPELTEAARIAIDLARFAARPVMAERDPPVRGV